MRSKPKLDQADIMQENDALHSRVEELEAQLSEAQQAIAAAQRRQISTTSVPPRSGSDATAGGTAPTGTTAPDLLAGKTFGGRPATEFTGKTAAALLLLMSDDVPRRPNPFTAGSLSARAFEGAEDRRIAEELARRKKARR